MQRWQGEGLIELVVMVMEVHFEQVHPLSLSRRIVADGNGGGNRGEEMRRGESSESV